DRIATPTGRRLGEGAKAGRSGPLVAARSVSHAAGVRTCRPVLDRVTRRHLKQRAVRLGLRDIRHLHDHISETWVGTLDHHGDFEVHGYPGFANNLDRLLIPYSPGGDCFGAPRSCGGHAVDRLRSKTTGLDLRAVASEMPTGMRAPAIWRAVVLLDRHLDRR